MLSRINTESSLQHMYDVLLLTTFHYYELPLTLIWLPAINYCLVYLINPSHSYLIFLQSLFGSLFAV